jgi:hypothetical protein
MPLGPYRRRYLGRQNMLEPTPSPNTRNGSGATVKLIQLTADPDNTG